MTKPKTIYQNQYIGRKYDRINLLVPQGMKETLKALAKEKHNGSVNAYILDAITKARESP